MEHKYPLKTFLGKFFQLKQLVMNQRTNVYYIVDLKTSGIYQEDINLSSGTASAAVSPGKLTPGPSKPVQHESAAESPVPLPAGEEVPSSSVGETAYLHTKPLRMQWITQLGHRLLDYSMADPAVWPSVWRCRPGKNSNPSMVRVKDLLEVATWIVESTLMRVNGPPSMQKSGRVGVLTQIYHHHDGPWALFTLVPELGVDNPVSYYIFGDR